MKKISCTIKGLSPLLMHRFPLVAIEGLAKMEPSEQAEYAAYRDDVTKQLYIPGLNLQRALVSAAKFSKGKGRASLQMEVCACVFVTPEKLLLGVKEYIVDSRPVVNAVTRGRFLSHRPRINTWKVDFEVEYDPVLMAADQLKKVITDAGTRVGILDFRPERKGPFGRFEVTSWK